MSWPVVPSGWELTTLGELGRYLNGRAFKKEEWATEGRPIIRIQNLTGSSDRFNFFKGQVDDRYVARRGDLLVSWAATLGAFIWPGPEAVINQHIFKVESRIDTRFHKYLLDHQLEELKRHTHGSGMVHITRGKFDSIPVAVPPLDEQGRIVDLLEDHLSRLDAAEAGLRKAKQRLQSLERSALETHFSGGKQVSLGELVSDIAAGKSYGASSVPAGENDWGIIKVSAMTWGEFRSEENKKVPDERVDRRFEIKPGDLLVSRANTADYVGASVLVGQVRPKLLLSDKSLRITTKAGVSKEWLWRALQAPSARTQIRNLATGTKDSMRNISQAALRQIQVPLVDEVRQSEQLRAFSMTSAATARLRGELEQASIRHASLRKSLLAVAFSGRLTAEMPAAELVSP